MYRCVGCGKACTDTFAWRRHVQNCMGMIERIHGIKHTRESQNIAERFEGGQRSIVKTKRRA